MKNKYLYRFLPATLVLALWTVPSWPAPYVNIFTDAGNIGSSEPIPTDDNAQDARADESYQRGTQALDERRWEKAAAAFDEVIRMNGNRSDGSLYWKAYAQNKLGQRDSALGTLGKLNASFPKSRWLSDAKALEMEIRQSMGQAATPENQADEDLKLMAINSLMNTDMERALPMLEKILGGNQAPKIKERALFVLAQSGSTRARDLMVQIARGQSNPDLQSKALNYLGLFGGKESRQTLAEIYASSTDAKIKRQILHSYMVGGDQDKLLAAAKEERNPDLRRDAIHQLGVLGAKNELWALYQASSDQDAKGSILHSLSICGDTGRLIEIARTEKDPKLRGQAIHGLGINGSKESTDALVSIYESQPDPATRKAAIHGLFVQGNVKALIQLARKESDPWMKKEIVSKLSVMNSREATDYLMEILNK